MYITISYLIITLRFNKKILGFSGSEDAEGCHHEVNEIERDFQPKTSLTLMVQTFLAQLLKARRGQSMTCHDLLASGDRLIFFGRGRILPRR